MSYRKKLEKEWVDSLDAVFKKKNKEVNEKGGSRDSIENKDKEKKFDELKVEYEEGERDVKVEGAVEN